MRSDFTVLTVAADENIAGLLPYMIESITHFTKPAPNIVVVNNNDNNDQVLSMYRRTPYITIIDNRNSSLSGYSTSYRHGNGLNAGMKVINTPYTAIIESDCVVCSSNWYKFNKSKYDMMCAVKGEKYNEEYFHMFFVMFETRLFKHINWAPSIKRLNMDKQADTGCEMLDNLPLPSRILKLNYVQQNSKRKVFSDPYLHYKTAELWNQKGDPIVAHFGRGSDIARRKAKDITENPMRHCIAWKNIVDTKLLGNNG